MEDSGLSVFYNIISTSIDKNKPWYNVKDNTIYIKANSDGFKYYLEADSYHPDTGRQLFIILSKSKIHESCRPCHVDNFGRLKIRPIAHKEYLQSIYVRDSNIKFEAASICDAYSSFII